MDFCWTECTTDTQHDEHKRERRYLTSRLRFKEKREKSGGGDVSVCTSAPAQAFTLSSFGETTKHRQHSEQARNVTA